MLTLTTARSQTTIYKARNAAFLNNSQFRIFSEYGNVEGTWEKRADTFFLTTNYQKDVLGKPKIIELKVKNANKRSNPIFTLGLIPEFASVYFLDDGSKVVDSMSNLRLHTSISVHAKSVFITYNEINSDTIRLKQTPNTRYIINVDYPLSPLYPFMKNKACFIKDSILIKIPDNIH